MNLGDSLLAGRRRLGQAKRKITGRTRPTGDAAARDGTVACLVCESTQLNSRRVSYARESRFETLVVTCRRCGYHHLPEHIPSRYQAKTELEDLPDGHPRLGTIDTPGREFHMAKMGVDILGGRNHQVLMYGAGRSLDNHHIAGLSEVSRVAISDIMKVRDDAEFIDANNPGRADFTVVVASEVIEHFRSPHEDFERLLALVDRSGLLICGTNIHDGGPLSRDRYIYYPDHTSYYSPASLRVIAHQAGVHLDFRAPLVGQRSRKRYVLMSQSGTVMEKVADYFGSEPYAPSELARPQTVPQRSHQQWREAGGSAR